MIITTYLMSILDLLATLYLTYRLGNIEANPFGCLLMSSQALVVVYKVVVVGIACAVLYRCKDIGLARHLSRFAFGVYLALTAYHALLISIAHKILYL